MGPDKAPATGEQARGENFYLDIARLLIYLYPMEHSKIVSDGITFDDVLLLPARSDFVPGEADTRTRLTREVELNIPLVSAPMDTVTEAALAIALAQEGGMGIIHKNLPADRQAREVEKVKRSENGVIVDPITLPPSATIATARNVMREYNVSGIPIVEGDPEAPPDALPRRGRAMERPNPAGWWGL